MTTIDVPGVSLSHASKPAKSTSDSTDCFESEQFDINEVDDEDRTINDKSDADLLTSLNESSNRQQQQQQQQQHLNEEPDSKMKIALMQKQLQHLTDLVQSALVNRDFSQLAVATTQLNLKSTSCDNSPDDGLRVDRNGRRSSPKKNNTSVDANRPRRLDVINQKTHSIKSELVSLKKMQENFNSTFDESIKSFVGQLNVIIILFWIIKINFYFIKTF